MHKIITISFSYCDTLLLILVGLKSLSKLLRDVINTVSPLTFIHFSLYYVCFFFTSKNPISLKTKPFIFKDMNIFIAASRYLIRF